MQNQVLKTTGITAYTWENSVLSMGNSHTINKGNQLRLVATLPALPCNPRIRKAELILTQQGINITATGTPKLCLYRVDGSLEDGILAEMLDYRRLRVNTEENEQVQYSFDITALLDCPMAEEASDVKLAVLLLDGADDDSVVLSCGNARAVSGSGVQVSYDSGFGLDGSARAYTHDLGRSGQSSVDLLTGSLMLEWDEFAWGGNRMPVTIKRVYNSAFANYPYTANTAIGLHTADFSAMRIGNGWKLNVMQSMVEADFTHDGAAYSGYIYNDENGTDVCFKESANAVTDENGVVHSLYEDVDGGDMVYNPALRTLTMGSEVYTFDEAGRLVSITDEHSNTMTITYSNGKLASVFDGAGREFAFTYDENTGFLTEIKAPDGSIIAYGYVGDLLNVITYPDGAVRKIYYSGKKPNNIFLYEANNVVAVYNSYVFDGDRVASVIERGTRPAGGYETDDSQVPHTTFAYVAAAKRATVTRTVPKEAGESTDTVTTTVYTFAEDGSMVGEYMYVNGENIGLTETADPATAERGVGARHYSDNLLKDPDFMGSDEYGSLLHWQTFQDVYRGSQSCGHKYSVVPDFNHGASIYCGQTEERGGICQTVNNLPAGDYTFSADLRLYGNGSMNYREGKGLFLRVVEADPPEDTPAAVYAEYWQDRDIGPRPQTVSTSFTLTESASVRVEIGIKGIGNLLVNSAQLESNPYAGPHNKLWNGGFDHAETVADEDVLTGLGWTCSGEGVSFTDAAENTFNGGGALHIVGNLDEARYAWQEIDYNYIARSRETLTFSGWAKADSLPADSGATFRLRAVVNYPPDNDGNTPAPDEFTADFAPTVTDWQYAEVTFAKAKFADVLNVCVYCDYDHNSGNAYFDNLQVVCNGVEYGLTAEDFEEPAETNSDGVAEATAETEGDGEDAVAAFEELTDAYGNPLTETTFTDGEFGTVYRSFEYDENGNNLTVETDARGNTTIYTVDPVTSRTTAVTDRCGNQTAYEYDSLGRTTKVTSSDAADVELAHVDYTYNALNNLTAITRGDGMAYDLAYTRYHNLASIGVKGRSSKLVTYAYKNGEDGRLKSVTYANGDVMRLTYNTVGQVIAEKWYNASETLVAYYKYAYDNAGNLVRSIDFFAAKEYDYLYKDGVVQTATEYDVDVAYNAETGEFGNIFNRRVVNVIHCSYDTDGKLLYKQASATGLSYSYDNPEDGNPVVHFMVGEQNITSHSKTDSFGRTVYEELQLGKGFVSRQFMYHAGEVTDEHAENDKVKSSAICHLVSQIVLSDERTITYEYDNEERITRVIDSVDGEWAYTYDALGQLLTEKHKAVGAESYTTVNAMEYDNYGNITKKNGVKYTYGNSKWKDLLTWVGNQSITYDAQGNPTSYLGHTLTWEKGRQLKSFDGITYTYNANGIRTSKTVDGVTHTYTLDDTKILRESWGENALVPLYDNEDSVCGIVYNDVPYFFLKNQQGDVIAITDRDGEVVARYIYDAWGKCTVVSDTTDCSIATINPYRYRGYYYDVETGLYYLQSRYYNPETGRFINADEAEILLLSSNAIATNCFTYCENSMINSVDPMGLLSLNSVKNTLLEFVNKIKNKLKQITEKLRIHYSSNYVSLPTPAIAIAIDAIIFAISKISHFAIKTLLKAFIAWAKSNTKSFAKFVRQYLIENCRKILLSLISFLARKFSKKYAWEKVKNKISNAVFGDSLLFRIYSAFSSIGNIIATLLDIVDGYWDDKMRIKV